MLSQSAFTYIIYFCFIYLFLTMVLCTGWVIRDRNKLKRKQPNAYELQQAQEVKAQ
ncbi:hypothetical protein [Brevibacillus sp. H7]|uniref:hypothetical protein n=1 Tax=Brevibacillus sp. H7 TaxID=3349138 RepID=UPI00382ABF65